MKKIALLVLALFVLLMAGTAFAKDKPKASHPPVVKHHADKQKIGWHPKPTRVKGKHLTVKHPKDFHPKNQHLSEVHPHKAKDTTADHEAGKTVQKASKGKKHHKFLIF